MGKTILNLAPLLYVWLVFFRFYVTSPLTSEMITSIIIFIGIVYFIYCLKWLKIFPAVYIFILALSTAMLLTQILGPNTALTTPPQMIANIGYALALLQSYMSPRTYEIQFYVVTVFFVVCMALGVDAEEVFTVSRNFVSIFVILNLSLYYIACQQNHVNPKISIALLALLISAWTAGRSGILTAGLVLTLTLILAENKIVNKIGYVLGVVVSVIFVAHYISFDVSGFFAAGLERFERLGFEDVRGLINKAYFESAMNDIYSLVFGADISSIAVIVFYGNNPHNSYINLHANFGMFGLLMVMFAIIFTSVNLIQRKKYIWLIAFVACVIRSATDIASYFGPLDLIIFSSMFHVLRRVKFTSMRREYVALRSAS